MNFFEETILPKAWIDAGNGVVENILSQEISDYHSYAKNPDSGENFRRFYRHIEPLHCYLARNVAREFSVYGEGAGQIVKKRVESYAEDIRLDSFFARCTKIAVLKGTIDLAHGDVLKTQIKNLLHHEKASVGLVFLDYSGPEKIGLDTETLENLNCLFLGSIKSLKDRYILIARGIANDAGSPRSKEIIWWGIPFGMIFVFSLSRFIRIGTGSFQSKETSGRDVFLRSLLTVKHHFSFSNKYVDKVYTSTPLVHGFDEIARPNIVQFKPSFYGEVELQGVHDQLSRAELEVIDTIERLKDSGALLFSSASRVDKTSNKQYLSAVEKILDGVGKSCLVCFGKKLPFEYQNLVQKYGKERLVFAGWLSPNATVRIIGMLNLFLDPFPFGAGMTFASAAYQKVPIVSTSDYVAVSPSSISILFHCYKSGAVKSLSKALVHGLFGSSSSLAERAIGCLNHPGSLDSEELKCIVLDTFVKASTSVLSPRLR